MSLFTRVDIYMIVVYKATQYCDTVLYQYSISDMFFSPSFNSQARGRRGATHPAPPGNRLFMLIAHNFQHYDTKASSRQFVSGLFHPTHAHTHVKGVDSQGRKISFCCYWGGWGLRVPYPEAGGPLQLVPYTTLVRATRT